MYEIVILGALGICSYSESISVEACELISVDIVSSGVPSVVSNDGTISISPNSGIAPYQYSIDGGQNFSENNLFENLPSGLYNVVVKDALEVCLYEESIRVEIESIIINEFNYRSSEEFDPEDWIELYNPKSSSVDLSNWQIRDENPNHIFMIPEGTVIDGNGFLIIVKDENKFLNAFPEIPFIGELGFGLGRSDAIRLFNSANKLSIVRAFTSINDSPSSKLFL